ncbi:hypothetical protein ACU686_10075 [Yinghuangia aomiensis]
MTALSRALFDARDEGEILRLATGPHSRRRAIQRRSRIPEGGRRPRPQSEDRATPYPRPSDRTVRKLAGRDGPVTVPGSPWSRALGLRGLEGLHGYLVVTSHCRPTEAERSLLATLVRHTAAALSVVYAHRRVDARTRWKCTGSRRNAQPSNSSWSPSSPSWDTSEAVHALMTDAAASGGGEEAVTRALHGSSPDSPRWSRTASVA